MSEGGDAGWHILWLCDEHRRQYEANAKATVISTFQDFVFEQVSRLILIVSGVFWKGELLLA